MVETSRDWSEKLPFALWAYRTSFRTSTGATPYSLVYGMEAMLPVEIEMGLLRVALEQQISRADWAQARFDRLNLLDERRLRAADHGLIRDPRGKFRPNWSRPYFIRKLTLEGAAWLMDLDGNRFSEPTNVDQLKSDPSQVRCSLRIIITHITTSSSCFICLLIDIIFTLGILRSMAHEVHYTCLHFIDEGMSFDHWVFEPSFLSFLSPYHLGLRYVPCLKTTLRPWDQMSSSTASTWTVVFGLLGSALEIHLASFALLDNLDAIMPLHLGEVTCSRIDDSMLPDLRPIIHFDAIQGHISVRMRFTDHEGVTCLSLFGEISPLVYMIIHGYEIHARSMFDLILSGYSEEPLLSHSARFIPFDIVVWSCLWCLDFPRHHFRGIRSVTRPIGVILGSSGQIGYI
ncbi:hypothetical protein CK203_061001 [Vitis vinifera]|uniref:Uncharacterized protein n=1 Tax=Vitis vinifera TaxID=29760 RepID=A0A438G6I9_VITVI|nr:hypothetical protein CK203_061001 [Vitis vinifera]